MASVDQAPPRFLLEQGNTLLFLAPAFGDVFVRGHPPATGKRTVRDCDHATVRELHGLVDRLARGNLTLGVADVLLGIP